MLRLPTLPHRRQAHDTGFTVVELAVGGFLASIMLVALAAFLMSSLRTGLFTEGQAFTINHARNVLQQIESEARGALELDLDPPWCSTPGACMEVTYESRQAPFNLRQARYLHTASQACPDDASGSEAPCLLRQQREEIEPETWTQWGDPEPVIRRVVNDPTTQKVFKCDANPTYLHVIVDLHVEPTPQSEPTFNVQTSFRPRNFPAVASCP